MTRWRNNGIERTRRTAIAIAGGVGLIRDETQLWESVQDMAALIVLRTERRDRGVRLKLQFNLKG